MGSYLRGRTGCCLRGDDILRPEVDSVGVRAPLGGLHDGTDHILCPSVELVHVLKGLGNDERTEWARKVRVGRFERLNVGRLRRRLLGRRNTLTAPARPAARHRVQRRGFERRLCDRHVRRAHILQRESPPGKGLRTSHRGRRLRGVIEVEGARFSREAQHEGHPGVLGFNGCGHSVRVELQDGVAPVRDLPLSQNSAIGRGKCPGQSHRVVVVCCVRFRRSRAEDLQRVTVEHEIG